MPSFFQMYSYPNLLQSKCTKMHTYCYKNPVKVILMLTFRKKMVSNAFQFRIIFRKRKKTNTRRKNRTTNIQVEIYLLVDLNLSTPKSQSSRLLSAIATEKSFCGVGEKAIFAVLLLFYSKMHHNSARNISTFNRHIWKNMGTLHYMRWDIVDNSSTVS